MIEDVENLTLSEEQFESFYDKFFQMRKFWVSFHSNESEILWMRILQLFW